MSSKPTVVLTFAGDEKRLTDSIKRSTDGVRKLSDDVGRSTQDMAQKAEQSTSRMGKAYQNAGSILLAQGAAFAANQAVNFLKGMADEAREAEKVARSTAQGIATMGAASWISAQQVGDLAESISNKIGVDDEVIQQSANLLLTFGSVKNAAGAMNNVFDRAVLASQDLAAKGFGDADAAAKMLGKALNDPIKGMTALGKAGVTFSQAQKDQIEKMVKSGDLLGAQKMLLAEVEKQVGGTAEATVDAGDKMAVRWANFQEQLGESLLPVLDRVLGKLMEFLDWAQRNPEIVVAIAAVTAGIWLLNAALNANPIVLVTALVAGLVAGIAVLWTQSEGFRNFFIGAWEKIKDVVGGVVDWVKRAWDGTVDFFARLPERIGQALGKLGEVFSAVFKGAVNVAIDAINWFIRRANDLIHGINVVNPFENIPPLPQVARLHRGGQVVGGLPGQEFLAVLQQGEVVQSASQSAGGGGGEWRVRGTGALAELIQQMFDDGEIQPVFR